MTLTEVADRINELFERYGLSHPVVAVRETMPIFLDPRENEPDITKWRASPRGSGPIEQLVLLDGDSAGKMELLLTTLTTVFDVFFEVQPPTGQGRLF